MRILFDNDVPWPLRKHLTGHEVSPITAAGTRRQMVSCWIWLRPMASISRNLRASMRFQQQVDWSSG